jgi:NADPH-dependent 2,4-dienoyl-CoA reductase/sulfur reductase-like enzyme
MRFDNVIIGGGLSGGMIAQEYREQGGEESVLIVAREPHPPYHRPPLTKDFLRGDTPAFDTFLHPVAWWQEHNVTLRTSTEVAGLDRSAHTITLTNGETIEFGRAALATGSTPRTLPGTVSIRTLDDSQAVAELLGSGHGKLGVIGGGFIGVEAAPSAPMKGFDVTMAVAENVVSEPLFGADVAMYFQRQLERHGVQVHTGQKELPEDDYDLVLAGIGVDPNVGLAEAAGLEVSNGVLVDEHLSASDGVWAVGDIANYQSVVHGRRLRLEHWDVAQPQPTSAASGRARRTTRTASCPTLLGHRRLDLVQEYVGPGSGSVEVRLDGRATTSRRLLPGRLGRGGPASASTARTR